MRFIVLMVGFIGIFAVSANAQTYYNAPNSSMSGNVPLNLKGMLQGNSQKQSSQTRYTYKGKPYGVDRSSYSLALSPQEARENKMRLNRERANREREKARQRTETQRQTEAYLRAANASGNSTNNQSATASRNRGQQAPKKRVLYNRDRSDFSIPKRVFNSPY